MTSKKDPTGLGAAALLAYKYRVNEINEQEGMNKFYNPATDDTEILHRGEPGDTVEMRLTHRFQKQMEGAIETLTNIGTKYEGRALIATGTDCDDNPFQITLNVSKDVKYFLPTGGKEVELGTLVSQLPRGVE